MTTTDHVGGPRDVAAEGAEPRRGAPDVDGERALNGEPDGADDRLPASEGIEAELGDDPGAGAD